ncbi:Retrovirus-related Pol polyprotein from transposon TNT 1-94, partial [Durusdinium trenchii]
ESLMRRIEELGEVMPKSATVLQLRARLSELQELNRPEGGDLRSKMVELNRAAKKKANLVEFAESKGIKVGPNNTIPKIYAKVEAHLTKTTPATAADRVNFGKHGDLTYGQVLQEHSSYMQWAIQIHKEETTDWRLARLATWGESQMKHQESKPKFTAGYMTKPRGSPSQDPPGDSSDGSFIPVELSQQDIIDALREELETAQTEKAELELSSGRSKARKET